MPGCGVHAVGTVLRTARRPRGRTVGMHPHGGSRPGRRPPGPGDRGSFAAFAAAGDGRRAPSRAAVRAWHGRQGRSRPGLGGPGRGAAPDRSRHVPRCLKSGTASWQTIGKPLANKLPRIRGAQGYVASWQHRCRTSETGSLATCRLAVTGIAEAACDDRSERGKS